MKRLRVTEEEASKLLSGYAEMDTVRLFDEALNWKRAVQAWHIWLGQPGWNFDRFCECFEVVS